MNLACINIDATTWNQTLMEMTRYYLFCCNIEIMLSVAVYKNASEDQDDGHFV